jgi:Zn finger protein HypA/HybF involved in hydrogenase expression
LLKEKVLDAYVMGSAIEYIATSFNITEDEVIRILREYRDESKTKRIFNEEFRKFIAERDINGEVTRKSISLELGVNIGTVKKACVQFGQAFKEKALSDQMYTKISRELDMKTCPTCNSRRVNEVEEFTTYCMECGDEYVHKQNYVLKVNYEYLEE